MALYTRDRIEHEIDECVNEMLHIRERLAILYEQSAQLENDYRVARAKAQLQALGKTVAEREAKVVLEVQSQRMAHKQVELRIVQCREELGIQRATLEGLRTLAANTRTP